MDKLLLKPRADIRIKQGHPWLFSNELALHPELAAGHIVEVHSASGVNYGTAFYNPHSLVSARLLFSHTDLTKELLVNRIENALNYRRQFLPGEETFRLIYGESDLLPGLIVDKYEDYLAVQFLSAGMDLRKDLIVESLVSVLPQTKGIIEKDMSAHRTTEGLPQTEEIIFGEIPENIQISENNIKFEVALLGGQKTGYYLDQKLNRKFLQTISKGKRVLDCFCNQGGFALNAAKAGADYALGVDLSAPSLELADNNAKINDFFDVGFQKAHVFEYLENASDLNEKWDIVILDPPAFTKNRKTVPKAIAGYAKINRLALKLLSKQGFLVSSSCSHHISEEVFLELISKEAAKLNKRLRIVYRGSQSPDHPILPAMPETNYLKFFVFQII